MNTKNMKLLLRSGALTQDEWVVFLENVVDELRPRLETFKLPTFGELACMDDKSGRYEIVSKHNPKEIGNYFLRNHGVSYFQDTGERLNKVGQTRSIKAWGLSKEGVWVLITVNVEACLDHSNSIWEHAESADISRVSLPALFDAAKMPPYSVWMVIRLEVEKWEAKRRMRYEDSKKVVDHFHMLDKMISSLV